MIKKIMFCSHAFDQNSPSQGALITRDSNFFHEMYPPVNFNFVRENVMKNKIGQIWADRPTPPFVQNGPHCKAPNTWVSIFFKTWTQFNFDFVQENVKKISN